MLLKAEVVASPVMTSIEMQVKHLHHNYSIHANYPYCGLKLYCV